MSTGHTFGQRRFPSLEEVQTDLESYLGRIDACILHGWESWQLHYAPRHHVLGARSRAAIIFDEIVAKAVEEFSSDPSVLVRRTAATLRLYFGDRFILRFKKLRKTGHCSNIMTQSQLSLLDHKQLFLPTMEPGTLLHAGYQLDGLGQELVSTAMVLQFRNRVLWRMDLGMGNMGIVEAMPPTPSVPPAPRFEPKPEFMPARQDEANKKGE